MALLSCTEPDTDREGAGWALLRERREGEVDSREAVDGLMVIGNVSGEEVPLQALCDDAWQTAPQLCDDAWQTASQLDRAVVGRDPLPGLLYGTPSECAVAVASHAPSPLRVLEARLHLLLQAAARPNPLPQEHLLPLVARPVYAAASAVLPVRPVRAHARARQACRGDWRVGDGIRRATTPVVMF